MKKKIFIFSILFIFITAYLVVNYSIGNNNFDNIKNLISDNNRKIIKKYIFPFKLIDDQKKDLIKKDQDLILRNEVIIQKKDIIRNLSKPNLSDELFFKEKLTNFSNKSYREIQLNDYLVLKKFKFLNGFFSGINEIYPGSGYLDFYLNNLIVFFASTIDKLFRNSELITLPSPVKASFISDLSSAATSFITLIIGNLYFVAKSKSL